MSKSRCSLYTDTEQLNHHKVEVVTALFPVYTLIKLCLKGHTDHHRLFGIISLPFYSFFPPPASTSACVSAYATVRAIFPWIFVWFLGQFLLFECFTASGRLMSCVCGRNKTPHADWLTLRVQTLWVDTVHLVFCCDIWIHQPPTASFYWLVNE